MKRITTNSAIASPTNLGLRTLQYLSTIMASATAGYFSPEIAGSMPSEMLEQAYLWFTPTVLSPAALMTGRRTLQLAGAAYLAGFVTRVGVDVLQFIQNYL